MWSEVVHRELGALVNGLSPRSPLVGEMEHDHIKMPLDSVKGSKKTWRKLVSSVAHKISNFPNSRSDCWLMNLGSNAASNYIVESFSFRGGSNRYALFRVLYLLVHPEHHRRVEVRRDRDFDLGHRCGLGRGSRREDQVCINPFHVAPMDSHMNKDQNRCRYGAAFLCPHRALGIGCIFNDPNTGLEQPCRSQVTWPTGPCPHNPSCLPQSDVVQNHQ